MLALLLATPPAGGTDLPLRLASGYLSAPVGLGNGVRTPFLLDTGSVGTFVTRQGARALANAGFKPDAKGWFTLRLDLGGVSVPGISIKPCPEAVEKGLEAAGMRGMLGLDVLARFQVGLDVVHRTARLWPKRSSGAAREWFGRTPFSTSPLIRHRVYLAYVTLGNVTTPLSVDTGAGETYLADGIARRIEGAVAGERDFVLFNDGLHPIVRTRAPSLRWAGIDIPGPNWIMRADGPYGVSSGLLGLDVLGRTRILFDFPAARVRVAGPPAKDEGLTFSPDERPNLLAPGGEFTGEWTDGSVTLRGWNRVVPAFWTVVRGKGNETALVPPGEDLGD